MTDHSRGTGGALGPPWSVDLLADLQAGVLDEQQAQRLWPQVSADPDAMAIIEALELTTADLAGLGQAPPEPIPAGVAARLDAALAAEASAGVPEPLLMPPPAEFTAPTAPVPAQAGTGRDAQGGGAQVIGLDAARKRRNRRVGLGAGLLTAAAAAIAAVAIVLPSDGNTTNGNAVALPPASSPGQLQLSGDGSDSAAAIGQVQGARDFGPLQDQQRLDACLQASGFDPAEKPVGIKSATVDGKPAVLVLMTTGKLAQFRLVAFSANCGTGSPGTLFDRVVGK